MPEPTNRLQGLMQRIEHFPPDARKCARDYLVLHVFASFHDDADLKKIRRSYRTTRRIQRWGQAHCTRMVLMIEGILALRELGLATYIKPRGRKRKQQ